MNPILKKLASKIEVNLGYDFERRLVSEKQLKPERRVFLKDLLRVKKLDLSDLTSPFKGLEYCVNLEELTLDNCSLTLSSLGFLKDLTKLKKLSLCFNSIYSYKPLNTLQHLVNLEELYLTKTSLTDLTGVECLKKLKKLRLGDNRRIKNINPLNTLENLEELNLSETSVNEWAFEKVTGWKKLRKLDVSYTNVGNIEFLSKFENLKEIDLYKCPVTNLGPLKWLKKVEVIRVNNLSEVEDLNVFENLTNLRMVSWL